MKPNLLMMAALLSGMTPCATAQESPSPAQIPLRIVFMAKRDPSGGFESIALVPKVTIASGSEATVGIGSLGATDRVNLDLKPTLAADGSIELNLNLHVKTKDEIDPAIKKAEEATRRQKEVAQDRSAAPVFHSALPTEGLFSVEDATGNRAWAKIGRVIDGWTLKSYDEKRAVLTLSRAGKEQELALRKANVIGTPNAEAVPNLTLDQPTKVTIKPGEPMRFITAEGYEVEIKADNVR